MRMKGIDLENNNKISVICQGCGKKYKLPNLNVSKKYKCKECGTITDFTAIEQSMKKTMADSVVVVPKHLYRTFLLIGIITTVIGSCFTYSGLSLIHI